MLLFGRRLRTLRQGRALTQEALAGKVGLDPKHLSGLERGEHGASFQTVERLAHVLNVDVFELFLPDRLASNQLELATRAVLENIDSHDAAAVRQFFRDLLVASRRLEGTAVVSKKG